MLGDRDFFELQREILTDPGVFERFSLETSINVTSFFRHPEQFRLLREEILPYLIYFTSSLQSKVMERFASSLHRDGFLILGPSESLGTGQGERFFGPYREGLRSYRWR